MPSAFDKRVTPSAALALARKSESILEETTHTYGIRVLPGIPTTYCSTTADALVSGSSSGFHRPVILLLSFVLVLLHSCCHHRLDLEVLLVEVRIDCDLCSWEMMRRVFGHRRLLLRRSLVRTQIGRLQGWRTCPIANESVKDLDDVMVEGQVVGHIGCAFCSWKTIRVLGCRRLLLRRSLVRTQIEQLQVWRISPTASESVKDLDDAVVGQAVGRIVAALAAAGQGKQTKYWQSQRVVDVYWDLIG